MILEAGETFHVTPLQLHAISERLKLAEPTCGKLNFLLLFVEKYDLSRCIGNINEAFVLFGVTHLSIL